MTPVPVVPRALARLQFHAGFTLDDALPLVDYYADLGVSHLYASPLFRARPGSNHGYDVVDYHEVNPEVGGEPALRRLVSRLRERGMGLILDIVPNHMYAGVGNAWWMDLLRHGRSSPYAGYFDIDFNSPDPLVRGRVLLPILGCSYAEALRQGEVRLASDPTSEDGFALAVYDALLPLAPATVHALRSAGEHASVLAAHDGATDAGFARLDALLGQQHYQLSLWKLASDMVNYRRFFDINELAGLRIERTRVFEDTHSLVFRLYGEGLIDGVRVDHVDGLADPHRYCRQLRHRLRRLQRQRPLDASRGPAYIVVEKILAHDEVLRPGWLMDGTTGYEFMDEVSALLHNPAGEAPLTLLWHDISDDARSFSSYARTARRQILVDSFEAELDRTARALFAAARSDVVTRDVSLAAIRRVLVELLIHFPVYRTYAGGLGRDAIDEAAFQRAHIRARRHVRIEDRRLLDRVSVWLGGQPPRQLPPGRVRKARERAMRIFQQATSPMAAKAVEDTACYRYGRLLSRNEVGADPQRLSIDAGAFHAACLRRQQQFPHNLLSTATHDHKRGEDARARLATLAGMPDVWKDTVRQWREQNAGKRGEVLGQPAPSPADEYMLYQTLVGAWPLDLQPDDAAAVSAFAERIGQWQTKALREAKRHSRWTRPNEPYEDACDSFLQALLSPGAPDFARPLHAFVQRIAAAGAAKGLVQTALKLTTPGLPDIYQGTEYWDFSLVDPDNRRAVDFDHRQRALAATDPADTLIASWRDGRIKQRTIRQLLDLRRRRPRLFEHASYRPLTGESPGGTLLAFERQAGPQRMVVLALPRTGGALLDADAPRLSPTALAALLGGLTLPGVQPGSYRDVLTGRQQHVSDTLDPARWLGALPVAVLERTSDS